MKNKKYNPKKGNHKGYPDRYSDRYSNRYPDKYPNRKSIRLKGYDYSQPGAYFITICTQNRECLYGGVGNIVMEEPAVYGEETWMV